MRRFIACLVVACALTFGLAPAAFADEALGDVDSPRATASAGSEGQDVPGVAVSSEGDAALADGAGFAMSDFSRAQKGTNRDIAGAYRGYSYLVGHEADRFVQVIATDDYAVVYVPASAAAAQRRRVRRGCSKPAETTSLRSTPGRRQGRNPCPDRATGASPRRRRSWWTPFATSSTRRSTGASTRSSSARTAPTSRIPTTRITSSRLSPTSRAWRILRGRDSRRAHLVRIGGGVLVHAGLEPFVGDA